MPMPATHCGAPSAKPMTSLEAFYRNFGFFGIGHVLKGLFFPFGRPCKAQAPSDDQIRTLGEMIMAPSSVRDALAEPAYISQDPEDAIGRVEATYNKLLEVEPAWIAFLKAEGKGQLEGATVLDKLKDAASKGIISESPGGCRQRVRRHALRLPAHRRFRQEPEEVKVHAERPVM